MKVRISATIDKETEQAIERLSQNKKFRNKSHIIETAIELLEKTEGQDE
jgi:Arc/MetJ-type ribon-helix-helix transcriptional regulator